jgi:hypothetical protein
MLLCLARIAGAQPAFAIGKPLPDSKLASGTVTVRVIAGSGASPVGNADVTLVVNGAARQARTDASGRATFKDLPVGAKVQAKIAGEDQKEIVSEEFPLPDGSGVRVMLSTKPVGGAPIGGGGGDPPMDPSAVSGQPRPDAGQPAGTYAVRVVHGAWKDNAAGVRVAIVGYDADDQISVAWQTTDAGGRVTFKDLDRTGATAYFVMALVPRGDVVDRLMASPPVMLDATAGVKLVLSGGKRDSTAPAIDDLTKLEKPDPAVEAGKIAVTLQGVPDRPQIELVDAATGNVVAKADAQQRPGDPKDIKGEVRFEARNDAPPGSLDVVVRGSNGNDDQPLANVAVRVTAATPPGDTHDATTDSAGLAHFDLDPQFQYIASATVNGRAFESQSFGVAQQGGVIGVQASWDASGRLEGTFEVAADGAVLYAQTMQRGQRYRSLPFLARPNGGTRVSLFVLPRSLFGFSLTSHVDDTYLAVQGRFEISNNSWAPFRGGPDGVLIPLPRGFKGAIVAPVDGADVAVDTEGFRILRPIPPGQRQFHGAFSLPIDNGTVEWSLDLPYGAFQSGIEILQPSPEMKVVTPPGVAGKVVTVPQGTFFVLGGPPPIPPISITPHQAMVMTIRGLPSPPQWTRWAPRIIGLVAVAVMLTGLAFALLRRREQTGEIADRAARRDKLLAELVELDADPGKKSGKRREQLVAELESLWE